MKAKCLSSRIALLVLAPFLTLAPSGSAAINVVSFWRMGKDDPGASPGAVVASTIDSISSNTLTVYQGPALYSSDVSDAAQLRTGSSLSIIFTNSAYALAGSAPAFVDNFGVECWVKPSDVADPGVIVYDGNTSLSGWGIIIYNNSGYFTYSALLGLQIIFGTNIATANVWTHLALVCDSGVCTFYVNGVQSDASQTTTPIPPTGGFGVGAPPTDPTNQFFTGAIDDLRVFTFDAGQFSTNDLLINSTNYSFSAPAIASVGAGSVTLDPTTGLGSVNIGASVNPNGLFATAWLQYGPRTNYGLTTTPVSLGNGCSKVPVALPLTCMPGVPVHFSVAAANLAGTNTSPDQAVNISLPGDFDGDGVVSPAELNTVYAGYLPTSPWLYLTNVAGLGGTNVTFALTNSIVGGYTVQYSTDLVNWTNLGPATPRFLFVDTNAPGNPQRFYRLSYP